MNRGGVLVCRALSTLVLTLLRILTPYTTPSHIHTLVLLLEALSRQMDKLESPEVVAVNCQRNGF